MMTREKGASKWKLHAGEIFIQIDYRSLLSGNVVVNKLIIDTLDFRQAIEKGMNSKKKDAPHHVIRKEGKNNHVQKNESKSRDTGTKVLIRHLLIRNGYFAFYSHTKSGEKQRLHMEGITLRRKEILLGHRLDVFFRSLIENLA